MRFDSHTYSRYGANTMILSEREQLDRANAEIERLRAALDRYSEQDVLLGAAPPAPAAVPPGYVLVPIEPTPEMAYAIDKVMWPGASEKAYRAMIAAAGEKP
jgi:hypothetical protein